MPSYRRHWGLLAGLLLWGAASALLAQYYEYQQFTTADGLPTNYVYGVVEDENGYIWAYTENGLAKFDGYDWQVLTTANGLPANDVVFAEKAPDGKVWLYTYNNRPAYLYQDSVHIIYDEPAIYLGLHNNLPQYAAGPHLLTFEDSISLLPAHEIDATFPSQFPEYVSLDTIILARSNPSIKELDSLSVDQVYVRNPDSIKIYRLKEQSFKQYLAEDAIVIIPNKEILWQHPATSNWQRLPLALPAYIPFAYSKFINRETVIIGDITSFFWVDLVQGEYRLIDLPSLGIESTSTSCVSVQEDHIWFNTEVGALRFDYQGQLQTVLKTLPKESGNYLHRTFTDSAGNIWIGSREDGLLFIPFLSLRTRRRLLSHPNDHHFERLLTTPEGDLIGITATTGLYHILPDTIAELVAGQSSFRFREAIATPEGLLISSSSITYLLRRSSTLPGGWSVQQSEDWIDRYNLARQAHQRYQGLALMRNAANMAYDPTLDQLVIFKQGTRYTFKAPFSAVPTVTTALEFAKCLTFDLYRQQFIEGTVHGLQVRKGEQALPILAEYTDLRNITTLASTPDQLWIGTESNGLFCYSYLEDTLRQVASLPYIRRIFVETDSSVLVASNAGVLEVSRNAPHAYRQFTTLDGLPTNEIEDVYSRGDAIIYVASTNGLHELDRSVELSQSLSADALRITQVLVEGDTTTLEQLQYLNYQQNNIRLHYNLLSYASRGNIQYMTRLEPLEEQASPTTSREVSYLDLAPGEYTFHLTATDIYGQTIVFPHVAIYIRPALWQRVWFKALAALLILGLAIGISIKVTRRRWQRLQQEKQQREELSKRMAELELAALKAQMNPHFVFNALGAIQYFIQTKDVEAADHFLTKFASLMRRYLDSSRESLIPLEQEIDLLQKYTELEQMRFEDLFQTQIKVQAELRRQDYYLPSMLIQPFVENAINHGLCERRDGKGQLSIRFTLEGEELICWIEDNGIGRAQARKHRRSGHRSRGMQIVDEKVDTLRTSEIALIDIEVQDLQADPQYPGTQVRIGIQNLENGDT